MMQAAELVIVGAGPAGLSAALEAAEAGARVTLIDAYPRPGGQYFRQPPQRPGVRLTHHQQQGLDLWQKVIHAGVTILANTLVWNLSAEKILACHGPGGSFLLKAQAVILATGPYERPAAFPGWTLPGVLMTGGAQTLLYQHVLPGKRVLLAGAGPLQLLVARKLIQSGAEVVAVLEGAQLFPRVLKHAPALWGQWDKLWEGASSLLTMFTHGVPYRQGWGIVSAQGQGQVESATIARLDEAWTPLPGTERTIACDTICIACGLVPFNALSRLAGAAQVWRPEFGGETPLRSDQLETSLPAIYAAGDGAGVGGAGLALLEGRIAGISAAAALGHGTMVALEKMNRLRPRLKRERAFQLAYADLFTPGEGVFGLAEPDTLVCRCEGVTHAQLCAAAEAGAGNIVNIKSATRAGMGECQGRMCGHQVAHTLAALTGKPVQEVGLNAPRPPIFPLPVGELIVDEME
jgi:D-hydroxyproline dehydrogenase subunit alpha